MKIPRIYCDGIYDLFHQGHVNSFRNICSHFKEPIELVIGVISDSAATSYKRVPVFNEDKRLQLVQACIEVHEAFITDTLNMDSSFMELHQIDYVVHSFVDQADRLKQYPFFEVAIKMGKFIETGYTPGISTTKIINESKELPLPKVILNKEALPFIQNFIITKHDYLFEYTLNKGLLNEQVNGNPYIGMDPTIDNIVPYNSNNFNGVVLNFSLDKIKFKNKHFNVSILHVGKSTLTFNQFKELLYELKRITTKYIYIMDIQEYDLIKILNLLVRTNFRSYKITNDKDLLVNC